MKVRFKTQYAGTFEHNNRLSYELVDNAPEYHWNSDTQSYMIHYNTKLLGLIPSYMMEDADGSEIPAIDVLIKVKQ